MADELIFGRLAEGQELPEEREPMPFTLIGYDAKTLEEREFRFSAKGTRPLGAFWDAFVASNANGVIDERESARLVGKCLVEEDRDRWSETVDSEDVRFAANVIAQVATGLVTAYARGGGAPRPTRSPSEPSNGQPPTGGTSTGGSSDEESGSGNSPSETPST